MKLHYYPETDSLGGGRPSGRHRAGARHFDRQWGTVMMIKFLARGTGSAAAAADYLTREQNRAPDQDQDQDQDRDPEKNPEEVKVLRGNPRQVAAVADTLQFEHKYTSGVIAWAPEDNPSEAQINHVVDEFEKTAWAGLEPDRYAWAAVQHREAGGGVHVHVLAARVDLETGKSLNIAAPGWQKTFDALRDWQNHENGWSRPDDPERARDVQPGHRAYIEAAQLRAGLEVEKDPRRLITDYLSQGIETGTVSDRATMVSALQRAGLEVPRQGEHYLTAADPESGGKWRLKGAIYERTSSGSDLQARLQKRAEQDREQIEALTQSELKKLAENLRQSVEDEVYIIVRDIKEHTRWMNAELWASWLRSVVVGVCLFLGILAGSWGLTRWYSNNIQSLIETRAGLEFEIQEARQTIERIEQTTWGVKLVEVDGRRFAILPESTPENPLGIMDGRPTVRLSSE